MQSVKEVEQDASGEAVGIGIILDERNLPTRSLVPVEIELISLVLACEVLIGPSASLKSLKGISARRVLVNGKYQILRILMQKVFFLLGC